VLNGAPVEAGETPNGIVIPPALTKGHSSLDSRLCLIFNEKASGRTEPMVAYYLESYTATRGDKFVPLPQALADLEKYKPPSSMNIPTQEKIRENVRDTIQFLKDYQSKRGAPSA
jgi:hypothetical protein